MVTGDKGLDRVLPPDIRPWWGVKEHKWVGHLAEFEVWSDMCLPGQGLIYLGLWVVPYLS